MTDNIALEPRLPDLNDLMQNLQLAKEIALKNQNPNSLVTATMAQAKLMGLDKGSSPATLTPSRIERVIIDPETYRKLNDELENEC